ncbi:MAG: protein tyrosine phosphatase [Myxococcota bacterium]
MNGQARKDDGTTKARLLFVCSRNQWRSPTAELLFRSNGRAEARSAGTSPKARRRVSAALLAWADRVYVMEKRHRTLLEQRFGRDGLPPVTVLDIPDEWEAGDPELVALLRASLFEWFD